MTATDTTVIPLRGEVWRAEDNGFMAVIDGVHPTSARPPFTPRTGWPSIYYRRRGATKPLASMRLDRFLLRFRRIASTPTGPFE